jgi:hypothetical protein
MVVVCKANAFLQQSLGRFAGWWKLQVEGLRKTRRQRGRDRNRHVVPIYCINYLFQETQKMAREVVVFGSRSGFLGYILKNERVELLSRQQARK